MELLKGPVHLEWFLEQFEEPPACRINLITVGTGTHISKKTTEFCYNCPIFLLLLFFFYFFPEVIILVLDLKPHQQIVSSHLFSVTAYLALRIAGAYTSYKRAAVL